VNTKGLERKKRDATSGSKQAEDKRGKIKDETQSVGEGLLKASKKKNKKKKKKLLGDKEGRTISGGLQILILRRKRPCQRVGGKNAGGNVRNKSKENIVNCSTLGGEETCADKSDKGKIEHASEKLVRIRKVRGKKRGCIWKGNR